MFRDRGLTLGGSSLAGGTDGVVKGAHGSHGASRSPSGQGWGLRCCAYLGAMGLAGTRGMLQNNEVSILYHCFQLFSWLQRNKQFLLPLIFSTVISI